MATLRYKQLAPTAECLESVYVCLQDAAFEADRCEDEYAQRALHSLRDAVSLLAGVVDRHITAFEIEQRVDGRA